MSSDSENPVPPQNPAPESPTGPAAPSSPAPSPPSETSAGKNLDDMPLLDFTNEDSCDQSYSQRVKDIFAEVGLNVCPNAPTLPPENNLRKRIYNYRINVAKTWMPTAKYKQLENKFDFYRHELVLLAHQEQRNKYKPEMTPEEKKAVDGPINRRLASDLQHLMAKKLDLVLQWLPSLTRKNLDNDSNILQNQIIRENELAKAESSSAATEMTPEERELEEKIMMHKLRVAEAWMPKDLLENLNTKFTLFQLSAAREEEEKAAEDIRSGMSADERRIQAMIRHQQLTLRVQQSHLNKLRVAESWIPEEQRLKIENEYSMMRARLWRRQTNQPLPGAWSGSQNVEWDSERRKPKRLTPLQKNPMVKIWKKKISTLMEGSRPVIDVTYPIGAGTQEQDEEMEEESFEEEEEDEQRLEELEEEQERLAEEEREFLRRRNEMLAAELGVAGVVSMEQTAEEERLAREEQEFLELEMKVAEEFEREFLRLEEQRMLRNMRINEEIEKQKASQTSAPPKAAPAPAAEAEAPSGGENASCIDTTLAQKQVALQELQQQLERLQHGELSEEERERLLREERMLKEEMEKQKDRKGTCRLPPPPPPPEQRSVEEVPAAAAAAPPPSAEAMGARPKTKSCPLRRSNLTVSTAELQPGWMDTQQSRPSSLRPPMPSALPGSSTVHGSGPKGSAIPAPKRQIPRPSSLAGPSTALDSSFRGSAIPAPTRLPKPSALPTPSSLRGSSIPATVRQIPRPTALPQSSTPHDTSLRRSSTHAPQRQQSKMTAPRNQRQSTGSKVCKMPQRKRI